MPENQDWGVTAESHSQRVERLCKEVVTELGRAGTRGVDYDPVEAERLAAIALECQLSITEFLNSLDVESKLAKQFADAKDGELYLQFKNESKTKMTDAALKASVVSNQQYLDLRKEQFQAESNYSKYKSMLGILKDAHYFFRGLSKKE